VIYGYEGDWPTTIDLADPPSPAVLPMAEIWGAKDGDVLCYSAADGDMDGDGRTDLIINEMLGDGVSPGTVDVGNLVIVSGRLLDRFLLFDDGFETGDTSRFSLENP
jgi:hypothetical protein